MSSFKNYFLINSLSGGGAERQVSLLISHLNMEKVICLFNEQSYPVAEEKRLFLFPRLHNSGFIRLGLVPLMLFRLWRKITPNRQTHIISFLQLSNIVGLCCKLIWGCRLTVSIRTTTSLYYKIYKIGAFTKKLDRLIFKYADELITNSEGSKQDLVDNFGIDEKKIQVIVNAYDIEKIDALKMIPIEDPAIEALFSKYKIILSVGRFSVEKGLAQALKIFKEIRKADPSVKYVLVGQGGEKSRLSSIARQLSLSVYDKETDSEPLLDDYDVLFLGFQNNPYQYCYRARLFLFPSLFEGMPNALAEAFICGVMCVASDCKSGPREVLSNTSHDRGLTYPYFELGYLMPVLNESSPGSLLSADEKSWVEVIKEVLENKEPFPSDTAFRKKREQFNKENVVKKWEKILDMPG